MVDEELVETTINIDDTESVELQDIKNATEKLDASDLPNGKYKFYYSTSKDGYYYETSYSFTVKDGKVSIV